MATSVPVVIDSRSEDLARALARGNSQSGAFAALLPQPYPPTLGGNAAAPAPADGAYAAGAGGVTSAGRVFLLPYAEGTPGTAFSLRLYGWRPFFLPPDPQQVPLWVPTFLAELACTVGDLPGCGGLPGGDASPLSAAERFCDALALAQGSLGNGGQLNSAGPGTGLVAWAQVDLCGCKYFSFDFQQADPVGMNCLWARA